MSQATTDAGRRSDARSWLVVVAHTVAVFGSVYVAAVVGPSPWLLPLWAWFGLALNGYLNLMHECAHSLTFRRRRTSERLARWFIAPLVVADFDGYRSRHLAHHKHLGSARDTKDAYLVRIDGGHLVAVVLRSLLLRDAVRKFRHQTPTAGEEPGAGVEFRGALVRIAVVQAAFGVTVALVAVAVHGVGARALLAAALAYGFVYAYGLASLTVLAATFRAVAEHQVGSPDSLREGKAALRNLKAGPLGILFFGSYGFADHATHHHKAGIPYYRLPATTAAMAADDPRLTPAAGYLATLRALRRRTSVNGGASPRAEPAAER